MRRVSIDLPQRSFLWEIRYVSVQVADDLLDVTKVRLLQKWYRCTYDTHLRKVLFDKGPGKKAPNHYGEEHLRR